MEQRPGIAAAEGEPGAKRGPSTGGEVDEASPPALAEADGDGAALRVGVDQVDGDRLGTAQAAALEESQRTGVPGTSRPDGVGSAGSEERPQLTMVQGPAAGQGSAADRCQVDRSPVVVPD